MLLEESRLYGRGRRFRHQIAACDAVVRTVTAQHAECFVLKARYDREHISWWGLSSRQSVCCRALVEKCFAMRNVEIADKSLHVALLSAEEALNLLKKESNLAAEFLDDLASASALLGLSMKEKEDADAFREDFASKASKPTEESSHALGADVPSTTPCASPNSTRTISSEPIRHMLFAVEIWTKLLGNLRTPAPTSASSLAAARRFFRAPERTSRLAQNIYDIFSLLDRVEDRIKLCKVQIRLQRCVIASPESAAEIVSLCVEIAEMYSSLGFNPLAENYIDKARKTFRSTFETLSRPQKLNWLLSVARFSPDTNAEDRLRAIDTVTAEAIQQTAQQRTASSFALLAQAKLFHSHLLASEGSIDEAVALALESRRLRLSLLPRPSSGSSGTTNNRNSTSRYRAIASYFDAVFHAGALHESQGSAREAHYYFSAGNDLALSLGATKQHRHFALRLAQLDLKRRRWGPFEDAFSGGTSGGLEGDLALHVSDGISLAEERDLLGDVNRDQRQKFSDASELYKQAEDTILKYTKVQFMQQLETATASPASSSASITKGSSFFTPRANKILSRTAPQAAKPESAPRLSMDSVDQSAASQTLPLRQMHIRTRAKMGVVELLLAVRELAPSRLTAAMAIFNECTDVILDLLSSNQRARSDEGGDTELTPPSIFDVDMAFLLYQLARTDYIQHSWSVQSTTPRVQSWWVGSPAADGPFCVFLVFVRFALISCLLMQLFEVRLRRDY